MEHSRIPSLNFVNENICIGGGSNESRSSQGTVFHSEAWMHDRNQ
jgi:hypothetical protein